LSYANSYIIWKKISIKKLPTKADICLACWWR